MTARFNVAIGKLRNRFGAALSTNLRQQHAHHCLWDGFIIRGTT